MDDRRTWDALGRGGATARDGDVTKYSGLADPAGAEELGGRLAALAGELSPTVVVVWEDPEDVLLGHIVGRELDLPVVRAYDADGLVGSSAGMPDAARGILVGDAVRDGSAVRAVRALLEQRGGSLAGTVVLIETPVLRQAGGEAGGVRSLVRIEDPAGKDRPDGA